MAGIFQIGQIAARKRALAAESEIYRQTLKLEIHNLRLYSAGIKQKFAFVSAAQSVFMFALPWMASIVRRRQRSRISLWKLGLTGWNLYRHLAPMLGLFRLAARNKPETRVARPISEDKVPVANI